MERGAQIKPRPDFHHRLLAVAVDYAAYAAIAGMLPLWLCSGPGAEERRAVALIVIGGQSLSLPLTLIVALVVYSLLDDLDRLIPMKVRYRSPV